jgi:hypothetical protein
MLLHAGLRVPEFIDKLRACDPALTLLTTWAGKDYLESDLIYYLGANVSLLRRACHLA